MTHFEIIASELSIAEKQVLATIELLDGGGTIPFISRYRKELTGNLDEVQIANIRDRAEQLRELDKRRESILKSINDQNKLTPELEEKINAAKTLTVLEDLYLPYKIKRRTRATIAKEKGLEPLAIFIYEQDNKNIIEEAKKYLDTEKGLASVEEAFAGARDIISEIINENQEGRASIRKLFMDSAVMNSKVYPGKEVEAQKFKDYFEWSEGVKKIPSHRLLAMLRGEKEGFLMIDIFPEEEQAIEKLENLFLKKEKNESREQVKLSVQDAYKRLMRPSIENDIRLSLKEIADEEAIKVFVENLRELLMTSPMGQKNILAIDPGFRTGCKVVCLDKQGQLLHNDVVYPEMPNKKQEAQYTLLALCAKYNIEAIAIGNGTAGRETEEFVKN